MIRIENKEKTREMECDLWIRFCLTLKIPESLIFLLSNGLNSLFYYSIIEPCPLALRVVIDSLMSRALFFCVIDQML